MEKVEIESFTLDHTKVKAPYVRLISEEKGPNGDIVSNFLFSFTDCILFLIQYLLVHLFRAEYFLFLLLLLLLLLMNDMHRNGFLCCHILNI